MARVATGPSRTVATLGYVAVRVRDRCGGTAMVEGQDMNSWCVSNMIVRVLPLSILLTVAASQEVRAQTDSMSLRSVVSSGLRAAETGRLDDAVALFKRCLRLSPRDSDCAYNLACVYSLKRDAASAVEWLSRSADWG